MTIMLISCSSELAELQKKGCQTPNEEDCYLVRAMMQHADQVIVLADHSKFGKRLFHRVVGFESIDILVTDQALSPEMKEKLLACDVEIVLAGGEDQDD